MASSLNGLKVGESESCTQRASPPLPENMVSPAQTEAGALSRSASSFPSHGYSLPPPLPHRVLLLPFSFCVLVTASDL
jgi:hypothetical protein